MIPLLLVYALHVHANSCSDEIDDLRKIVEENTGMVRAFKETVNNQERRIRHLEIRLANSEDEKLELATRLEALETLTFEIQEDPKVAMATQEALSPACNGTDDDQTGDRNPNKEAQSSSQSGNFHE
jgi:arginine/lysine/ornithine decarboxylase